jgi:hypothetical protein
MMASLFLGITLGPTATSIVFKMTQSINSIFYMVLGCNVLFFLYVQFIMPESNPLENAKPTNEEENKNQSIFQRLNIFGALHILYRTHSKFASRWTLLIIAMVHFLMQCVLMPPSILYAMLEFGWTAIESGFYISVTSFLKLLIVSLVLPLLAKLFHKSRANAKPTVDEEPSSSSTPLLNENVNEDDVRHIIRFDKRMVIVGISAEVVAFLMFGVAFDSKQFTAAGLVQSIGILAQPSIRSMLTTLVDPSEVGELLGAVAVAESFASK